MAYMPHVFYSVHMDFGNHAVGGAVDKFSFLACRWEKDCRLFSASAFRRERTFTCYDLHSWTGFVSCLFSLEQSSGHDVFYFALLSLGGATLVTIELGLWIMGLMTDRLAVLFLVQGSQSSWMLPAFWTLTGALVATKGVIYRGQTH